MATERKYQAILPDEDKKIVEVCFDNGPGLHRIEHCVCTPSFGAIVKNAPTFHLIIPITDVDKPVLWKDRTGFHSTLDVSIAITGIKRFDQNRLLLFGAFQDECVLVEDTWLIGPEILVDYNLDKTRRGFADIPRNKYLQFLEKGRRRDLFL